MSVEPRHWCLAGAALVISLLACELACRFFLPDRRLATARVWMLSSPSFVLGPLGAVRYRPNERVRALAVYDGSIEYDVRYRTNDLGFIDDEDYGAGAGAFAYALVGDSFTAGAHGGRPWIPDLRRRLRRASHAPLQIYNLGVEGTGLHHFEKLLAETREHLRVDEVFILAISDDFRRPYWIPETSRDGIRFCEPSRLAQCRRREPIATIVDERASAPELVAQAAAIRAARELPVGAVARMRAFAERSALLREAQAGWRALKGVPATRENTRRNAETMRSIAALFDGTPVHLVHLPQKEEILAGGYSLDPRPLAEGVGIDYVPALDRCSWDASMFFPHDSHPNARGYRAIRSCVGRLLEAADRHATTDLALGLHMDLTFEGRAAVRTQAIAQAKALHAKISRNSLLWHQIEAQPGGRDWNRTDAVVDELVASGIEPLLVVYGSPCWANGTTGDTPECYLHVPTEDAAFATWTAAYQDFMRAAVARYRGRVKKWELWNEQNDVGFWRPTPDPVRYARWFRAITHTVRTADPRAEVAIGGLSGLCCTGPKGISGFAFLEHLYAEGVLPDAVAIHPYTDHAPDEHRPYTGNFDDIATVREIMVAAGQVAKPMWVTEWGWGTDKLSEREQAAYVEQSLNMLIERYPYVTVATYFLDQDRLPAFSQGLHASDGRLKPAGAAFRVFAAQSFR